MRAHGLRVGRGIDDADLAAARPVCRHELVVLLFGQPWNLEADRAFLPLPDDCLPTLRGGTVGEGRGELVRCAVEDRDG